MIASKVGTIMSFSIQFNHPFIDASKPPHSRNFTVKYNKYLIMQYLAIIKIFDHSILV